MKNSIRLGLIILISILNIHCSNNKQRKVQKDLGEISVILPQDFKLKSVNHTIIDIRTPREYGNGHIEGAININLFDKDFLNQLSKYDKEQPIFIYCRSGNRTSTASKKMVNTGFKQVYDLQGGIKNWARTNNKIVK